MRRYSMVNVFSTRILAGNPVAIVHDTADLSDAMMQAIARELHVPCTVFVSQQSAQGCRAAFRIFAPIQELQFAGHPTLGLAAYLARAGGIQPQQMQQFRLRTQLADVACEVVCDVKGVLLSRVDMPVLPQKNELMSPLGLLLTALSLSADDLRQDAHHPRQYDCPMRYLFVPLKDHHALGRISPDAAFMQRAFAPHHSDLRSGIYAYAMDGGSAGTIRARCFSPASGVLEDPATGVAAAGLACVLQEAEPINNGSRTITVEQGFEMGRPSQIYLRYWVENGVIQRIQLAGHVLPVSEGKLLFS